VGKKEKKKRRRGPPEEFREGPPPSQPKHLSTWGKGENPKKMPPRRIWGGASPKRETRSAGCPFPNSPRGGTLGRESPDQEDENPLPASVKKYPGEKKLSRGKAQGTKNSCAVHPPGKKK